MRKRIFVVGLLAALLGWLPSSSDASRDDERPEERPQVPVTRTESLGASHAQLALARLGRAVEPSGAGYRARGEHFVTWQEERARAEAWAEELQPLDGAAEPPVSR